MLKQAEALRSRKGRRTRFHSDFLMPLPASAQSQALAGLKMPDSDIRQDVFKIHFVVFLFCCQFHFGSYPLFEITHLTSNFEHILSDIAVRQTDTQTDRQTDRHTDTQTDR